MANMMQIDNEFRDLRIEDPQTLSAKEKILRTAIILFNRHGVHSTGIDRIIAESDVAKMTFYKHFPSKSDLIMAYLSFRHEARFANLRKHTTEKTNDPTKQILGVFDSLEDWFCEEDFNGCPFVRGLSDFGEDKTSPVFALVDAHFGQWSFFLEEKLTKILRPASVKTALSQIMSLIVGSAAMALATKDPKIAQTNKKLVDSILKAAARK